MREIRELALFSFGNALLTVGVMSFLVWVVFFNAGDPEHPAATGSVLPAANAVLNSTCAILIGAGLVAARRRRFRLHATLMISGILVSALFLASYVYYHFYHGHTPYPGDGWIRIFYLATLAGHIVLSMVVFPMILTSVFLALTRRLAWHRRFSIYTWSIWMYVSVSGVGIYLMLYGA